MSRIDELDIYVPLAVIEIVSSLEEEIERLRASENLRLPADIDYASISGLSKEIQHKLAQARPETLGQASRIPGVTPAAVSLLMIHLKKRGAGQQLEHSA